MQNYLDDKVPAPTPTPTPVVLHSTPFPAGAAQSANPARQSNKTSAIISIEPVVASRPEESPLTCALKAHYQAQGKLKNLLSDHAQPIAEINLSISETRKIKKDKAIIDEKGEKQTDAKQIANNSALQHYEEEYNIQEPIAVGEIFTPRPDDKQQAKRLLILGRAGIGKSTMSQYFAYTWSQGELWNDRFDYVFWIPLRKLADSYYQKLTDLSLATLIYRECFGKYQNEVAIDDIKKLLKEQCARCLFLLDGHDEIVALLREHSEIKRVYDQMLEMEYIILTSRPYSLQNTVLFHRQLENVGFTDKNICDYVNRYFHSLEEAKQKNYEEKDSGRKAAEQCLTFLKANPSLWGSAHVPINLALTVESWQQALHEEQKQALISFSHAMNLTQLYQTITRYLVKRCLEKRKEGQTDGESDNWLYKQVELEIAYLEQLAFQGLQQTSAIDIEPKLQREVLSEIEKNYSHYKGLFNCVLELGFLKTVTDEKKEAIEKKHYFIHLTFQEFFAARYLIASLALPENNPRHQQAIHFIRNEKYNPRYQIMLGFVAGLLSVTREKEISDQEKINIARIRLFWNTLLAQPLDISGAGHSRLLVRCFEEARGDDRIPFRRIIINDIRQWVDSAIHNPMTNLRWLLQLISVQPYVMTAIQIQKLIQSALNRDNRITRGQAAEALGILSEQGTIPEFSQLIHKLCEQAKNKKEPNLRRIAIEQLSRLSEKMVSDQIKQIFCDAVDDEDIEIKKLATEAVALFHITVVSSKLISAMPLSTTVKDKKRENLEEKLAQVKQKEEHKKELERPQRTMEKTFSDLEIQREIKTLCHSYWTWEGEEVAVKDLVKLCEKASTSRVINALYSILEVNKKLGLKNWGGCDMAEAAWGLGRLGEEAATPDVIAVLWSILEDESLDWVSRCRAVEALGRFGEKAAVEDLIEAIQSVLADKDIRYDAVVALGRIGEKAATPGVIKALRLLLADQEQERPVRREAAMALGNLGEKAAADEEVIKVLCQVSSSKAELVTSYAFASQRDESVKCAATEALGKLGEKAATVPVINALCQTLGASVGIQDFRHVRPYAAKTLGEFGEKAATDEVIQTLCKALVNKEEKLWALLNYPPTSSRSLDYNIEMRRNAAWALGNLGEKVAAKNEVIKILCQALGDEDPDVRSMAVEALGKLGKKVMSEPIIQSLYKALVDKKSWKIRYNAAEALVKLKLNEQVVTDSVLQVLCEALGDKESWNVRANIAEILGKLGEKAATDKVTESLCKALSDEVLDVRLKTAEALVKVTEKVDSLNPVEIEMLCLVLCDNKLKDVRRYAILLLGRLGKKAVTNSVLQALHQALRDDEQPVVLEAAIVLTNLGERTTIIEITNVLCRHLRNNQTNLVDKHRSITALAQLGEKAIMLPSVKETLQILLSDSDTYIREQAAKALNQLSLINLLSRYLNDKNAVSMRTLAEIALKRGASIVIEHDKENNQHKLLVEEGQNKPPLLITSIQANTVREAFAVWSKYINVPQPCLTYAIPIDRWNESKDQGAYVVRSCFAGQAIKIQLNHQHANCKQDVFTVFAKAVLGCDHSLQYLDLSGNQLDDLAALWLADCLAKNKWPHLHTLVLSNNHLSEKGLQYLLNALPQISLNYLLLDRNRIGFDSHFCEKVLEPKIKQSQLELLNLSMNFIYKGELLDEKGISSSNSRIVFDKLTMKQKLPEERRLYVKRFFAVSPVMKSACGISIHSLIDEKLEISATHGVIALLANKTKTASFSGEHAYLALEGVHKFGQRFIITGDLFFNESTKSIIIRVKHCSPQEYLERTQEGERVHTRTGRFLKADIKKTIQAMLAFRDKQGFYDYKMLPGSVQGTYNCLKWAVEMLHTAGVVKEPNSWVPSYEINRDKGICLLM